jgi:hypothetical protein
LDAGRNPEQRDCRPVRATPTLLPVSERVDADADHAREALLREPEEVSERHDVGARLDLASEESAPNPGGHGACELISREFGNVGHGVPSR